MARKALATRAFRGLPDDIKEQVIMLMHRKRLIIDGEPDSSGFGHGVGFTGNTRIPKT